MPVTNAMSTNECCAVFLDDDADVPAGLIVGTGEVGFFVGVGGTGHDERQINQPSALSVSGRKCSDFSTILGNVYPNTEKSRVRTGKS